VRKLLDHYRLVLPTTHPIRSVKDSDSSPFFFVECDPTTALLISLPTSSTNGTRRAATLETDCGGDWAPDEQAIVDITFDRPLDAHKRFKALVRDFHLDALEVSDDLVKENASGKKGRKRKAASRFRSVKLVDVQPRWKLFTTCEATW
jgi:hypothetical protein